MGKFHIGIDFGTSQTKICTTNMDEKAQEKGFVFHRFNASKSYVLPSTLSINQNGTCSYGLDIPNQIRYFKMKSLFDNEPRYQIVTQTANLSELNQKELEQHPELCSILYLTYCLLEVTSTFEASVGRISLLEMDQLEETRSNEYFFCIGIPTEYDRNEENYSRRCKQYEILYLSVMLLKRFNSTSEYCRQPLNILLELIKEDFNSINPGVIETRKNQEFYESLGLYVIAETTAGIVPFRNDLQRQLDATNESEASYNSFKTKKSGYYVTMDVGAGTTDISFFQFYLADGIVRMKYYASKSIPIASNYLILRYLNSNNLEDILEFDLDNVDKQQWEKSQEDLRNELFEIIRAPSSKLFDRVRLSFKDRIRESWHYESYKAKGCKVYGGGSRFREFSEGKIMLHNGGVIISPLDKPEIKESKLKKQTYTSVERFINSGELQYNIKLVYPNGSELSAEDEHVVRDSIDILNTCLGLSIVDSNNRPDGKNGWIDPLPTEVTKSPKEGMALFDIFNRDWL